MKMPSFDKPPRSTPHEEKIAEAPIETAQGEQERLDAIKLDREEGAWTSPTLERITLTRQGLFGESTPREYRERLKTLIKRADKLFAEPKLDAKDEAETERSTHWNSSKRVLRGAAKKAHTEKLEQERSKEPLENERWAMETTERRYLDAYAEYTRKNNALVRGAKEGLARTGLKTDEMFKLEQLKKEYDASRFAYLKVFEKDRRAELDRKLANSHDEKSKKLLNIEFARELVSERTRAVTEFGRKRLEARQNLLSEREKKTLNKTGEWIGKQKAQAQKFIEQKTGITFGPIPPKLARVIRASVTALVITGGAAVAGANLPVLAGLAAFSFGKSLAGGVIGTMAGEAAAKGYEKYRGKAAQSEAKEKLETLHDTDLLWAGHVSKRGEEFEKLESRTNEKTLEQKKAVVAAGTGFLSGFVVGGLSNINSWNDLHHHVTNALHQVHGAVPHAPTVEVPVHLEIQHGQGAGELYQSLKDKIAETPGLKETKLGEAILKNNPNTFAQAFGFPKNIAEGVMRPGDSFEIKDHTLFFHRPGHASIQLMVETAGGEGGERVAVAAEAHEKIQELFAEASHHGHHHHLHHGATKHVHHKTEHVSAAQPTGHESDALNQEQLKEYKEFAKTQPHHVAPEQHHAQPESTDTKPQSALDALTHSEKWSTLQNSPATDVFETPATDESSNVFRNNLFSMLRSSGVGPHANESVAEYVRRASEALDNGKSSPTAIYQMSDQFVARGGDDNARAYLTYGFLTENPSAKVIVENSGQTLVESFSSTSNGEIFTTGVPYTGKPLPPSDTMKVIF